MSAITRDGNLIHYEVLGRGRPVILLHGWIGSWRYWIPTMQLLLNKYRVYALDLYGFGDSAKNPQHYSLDKQIALLDDFMQELGIPKAALIGHGLGAMIAAEFARRNADKVPRLLLADAPLFDPGDLKQRTPAERRTAPAPVTQTEAAGAPAPSVMTASSAMRAALMQATRSRSLPNEPEPAAQPDPAANHNHNPLLPLIDGSTLDALLGRCFRRSEPNHDKLSVDVVKTDPAVLHPSVETFDSGRMLDTLRLLTMPTLIVHGSDDPLIPQPNEDVLNYLTLDREHSVLPILLPNVRHFPMLEDDRFARLANEFLDAPDVSKIAVKERWRRRTR